MKMVWHTDVNDVDIVPFYDILPIGFRFLPPPAIGKFLQRFRMPAAHNFKHRFNIDIKKMRGLLPGIAVGFAHKLIAYHSDV